MYARMTETVVFGNTSRTAPKIIIKGYLKLGGISEALTRWLNNESHTRQCFYHLISKT